MCECVNRGGSKNKINVIFYERRNSHKILILLNSLKTNVRRVHMFIYVFGLLNLLNAKSVQM